AAIGHPRTTPGATRAPAPTPGSTRAPPHAGRRPSTGTRAVADRPGSPRQCPAMLPAAEHRQQHLFRLPPLEEDLFPREPRDPVAAFGEREVPSSVLPVPVRIVVEAPAVALDDPVGPHQKID